MPDFGSDAIDDALDDDLPEVDTDETDEPDSDEIDAALDGPGDTGDTDDAPDTADAEAETDAEAEADTSDAPDDDDLTVEPTDEIDDTDPDSDGMPQARQRRRPPRRQRRAWRETGDDDQDTDDHEVADTEPDGDTEREPSAAERVDARLDGLTDASDDSDPAEPPSGYGIDDDTDEQTLSPATRTLPSTSDTDSDDTGATRGTSTVTASGEVWPDPPDGKPTAEAVGFASIWLPLAALAFLLAAPVVAVPVAAVWMLVSLPLLISSTGGREPEVAT